jgi:hypothetical protein
LLELQLEERECVEVPSAILNILSRPTTSTPYLCKLQLASSTVKKHGEIGCHFSPFIKTPAIFEAESDELRGAEVLGRNILITVAQELPELIQLSADLLLFSLNLRKVGPARKVAELAQNCTTKRLESKCAIPVLSIDSQLQSGNDIFDHVVQDFDGNLASQGPVESAIQISLEDELDNVKDVEAVVDLILDGVISRVILAMVAECAAAGTKRVFCKVKHQELRNMLHVLEVLAYFVQLRKLNLKNVNELRNPDIGTRGGANQGDAANSNAKGIHGGCCEGSDVSAEVEVKEGK